MAVACGVGLGVLFGEFVGGIRPFGHATRPILVVLVLAIVVGLVSSLTGQISSLVSFSVMMWLLVPGTAAAEAVAIVLALVIVFRLVKGRFPDVGRPVAVAAVTFFVIGAIRLIPMIPWSAPAQAAVVSETRPTYLVLVDGYPRADTLDDLGVDISAFLSQLEDRGFEIYPEATSAHTFTFATLASMAMGEAVSLESIETRQDRDDARAGWALPDGFVAIPPPFGGLTFPNVPELNVEGTTAFEEAILHDSAFASVSGDLLMDGLRHHLEGSLRLLGETEETMVFAHFLAPHIPFLYEGENPSAPPDCWPSCSLFQVIVVDDPAEKIGGYLEWLNPRLIEAIDGILAKQPDAEIVLFSDHGARFSLDRDEWHRTFLAARTPSRPTLFASSPHPRSVLDLLGLLPRPS